MTDDEGGGYRIDRVVAVDGQIRELAYGAAAQGLEHEFFTTLKSILSELGKRQLDWGDPEYRTRKRGGIAYHGARTPVFVRYAVFEEEPVVMLLKVKAMPGSFLE
jgi:hypothetical protein